MALSRTAVLPFLLCYLCLPLSQQSPAAPPYNTSSGPVPGKLNVHIVPHTHDDVGWLKTLDQYYVGSRNDIQAVSVQLILDTVVAALSEDPNRKFIYVEQAYFWRWWREQSTAKKTKVKKLVEAGQLEFINGGWCMHDEATTHYIDMIDQTTLGHRLIKQQFGKSPRIGWQIDPFGHSSVQAYLLGAELGFDALYLGRIDYQDKNKRKQEKSLEFIWQGSKSFGSSSQIFTGVFLDLYVPPHGFMFETGEDTIPIQDDPLLFGFNVKERVNDFVSAAEEQAQFYRTNHIMFTMGNDFTYQNAQSWFREMDRFIHHANLDGRINTFYSTPSIYTDAKYAANETWPLKTADFFPYADREKAYWTGYFTSRPALKGYARMLSGYYLAARQLEVLVGKNHSGPTTDALGEALAVVQHHDGISGTEKQHVADDYSKRLAIGAKEAEQVVNSALTSLMSLHSDSVSGAKTTFEQCPLLNISHCPPSEGFHFTGKKLVVVVYNPVAWERIEYVRIPVSVKSVIVKDDMGNPVPSQILPLSHVTERLRKFYVQAYLGVSPSNMPLAWLTFKVVVPPLGFKSYFVSLPDSSTLSTPESSIETPSGAGKVIVGPGSLKLTYSVETGYLTEMVNHCSGASISIEQSYLMYNVSTDYEQIPGAYISRPNEEFLTKLIDKIPLTIVRGPLVHEVHQQFSPWVSQVTRMYIDNQHVEAEFMIGPIPTDDGIGKEVITRLSTNIASNKTFYTDSNGRDFLRRVRNYRSDWNLEVNEPIAGNYYPLNLGMYIKDEKMELSVLVDRPVGGSSIVDGQLELMLHRSLLDDDARGVGEPLHEVVCVGNNCEGLTVQGKYFFSINLASEGSRWRRSIGQQVFSPLLLAFSIQEGGKDHEGESSEFDNSQFSQTSAFQMPASSEYSLPENVAMITLQETDDKSVLLRLAHLFEIDEDKELSSVAAISLKSLFAPRKILKVTELSLSASQEKSSMRKPLEWRIESVSDDVEPSENLGPKPLRGGPFHETDLVVELGPMEIRTFFIHFDNRRIDH